MKLLRQIGWHFKEAFQGIKSHIAMAISASTAITITLVLVCILTIVIGNASQISKNVAEDVQIFVAIENDVPEEKIDDLSKKISVLEGVIEVVYSDKDSELDRLIASYGEDGKVFEIYREDNPLSRAFLVKVAQGTSLSKVATQIGAVEGMKEVEFGGSTTEDFMNLLSNLRRGGYIIIAALTLLAIFLITNTINITINARKEEIAIMRQIGASNINIKIPFILEGIFIGIIGSVLPICLTIFGYKWVYEKLGGQLVSGILSLIEVYPFVLYVSAFLLACAILVGIIGSFISVSRYLRWKR